MGYQGNKVDIFPAIVGNPVRNGSMVVCPGTPIFACNTTSTSGTVASGNGTWASYGTYGVVSKTYPMTAGVAATFLGGGQSVTGFATSGQYHRDTSSRFDDVRYYTSPTGSQGNPQPD